MLLIQRARQKAVPRRIRGLHRGPKSRNREGAIAACARSPHRGEGYPDRQLSVNA